MSTIAQPRAFNSTGTGPDKVYTTGQIARMCHVANRTAQRWIDSGELVGYKIPGSQDRRVPRDNLLRFLEKHGMPMDRVEVDGLTRCLFIGSRGAVPDAVADALPRRSGYAVRVASSQFEAGLLAAEFWPHVVIVDVAALGKVDSRTIAQAVRALPGGSKVALILLGSATDGFDLGYDASLATPLGIPLMVQSILADRKRAKA